MFIFLFTSLLEYNCFTRVCQFLLYNKVNQLYIYICSHISSLLHLPPSHPPHPTPRWSQSTELISLCYAAASYQLSIFYVWQCIYVHATLSLCHSLPFPLPISSSPFSSRSLSLFPPCPQVLHDHFFFLDSTYMLAYGICFSLTYFTLYDSLQVHPYHYK